MPVTTFDAVVDGGADYSATFAWTNSDGSAVNLSGYAASSMIRQSVSDAAPLVTLTDTGGITLGGAAGTIVWSLTKAQIDTLMGGLKLVNGAQFSAYYDIILTSGTGVHTVFCRGRVTITQPVTR